MIGIDECLIGENECLIGENECLIGENECAHGEEPTFFPGVICKRKLMRMDRLQQMGWALPKDRLPCSECLYEHQPDCPNFKSRYLPGGENNG